MYALAAPPGWYWLDSAELSASAVGLGSSHPTGFPLYCVLAKAATLIPFGELAFRINLLSAACAALAVLWVVRLVVEACRDDVAAIAGGAAAGAVLALSLTFFRQATIAEVYAPTAAVLALTLLLFARVARGAGPSAGLLLAVVAGLGIGLHGSFRLLMALPIVALLAVRLRHGARWVLVAPVLALGIAAAIHSYLPVRAGSGNAEALDWGHPETVGAFVDHAITAKRIRTAFADEMFSAGERATWQLREQVSEQLGPLVLLAALAGLVWLALQRRERWLAATLGVVIAGDAAYAIWLNPMGLRDLQNGVPLALAVACAAGVGIAWLARFTGRGAAFTGGAAAVLLVIPVALVSWGERWAAADGDAPRAWSEAALAAAPPRSLVLVQSDDVAAGTMFLTTAEAARPDVAVLVRQHLWDVRRNRTILSRAGIGDVDAQRVLGSVRGAERAVLWEYGVDSWPERLRFHAGTAVGRIAPEPSVGGDVRAALEGMDRVFAGEDAGDRNARRVHAHAVVGVGRVLYDRGRLDAAAALFEAATVINPRHVAAWVNWAVVQDRQDRHRTGATTSERALGIDPYHITARVNAARFRMNAGDDEMASFHIEFALELAPGNAAAWSIAGILDARAKRYERARLRLAYALWLDPNDQDARRAYERLRRGGR